MPYGSVLFCHPTGRRILQGGDIILYAGEPQFTYAVEEQIEEYCESVRSFDDEEAGAIVMNCNPFTRGHRYLIEMALTEVRHLYLFVVEEDLSDISFRDRFAMVQLGTEDLKNVHVVPSGRFIISKDTFKNYFEKENEEITEADAVKDVYLFAKKVAKELNITKRFVGEEPFDEITRQYNRQMAEVLPRYGIELIEIPRKSNTEGIISASKVRSMIRCGDWGRLRQYVPGAGFKYLYEHFKDGLDEACRAEKNRWNLYVRNILKPLLDFIDQHDKVIVYGLGENADLLLSYVPDENLTRLVYCDRKASSMVMDYRGRAVISPEQIREEYRSVPILVSSSRYAFDIYKEFKADGILDTNEVIFNNYRLELFA